ncbi:Mitochondrial translocator assembly and maintenance protein 41 [Allomyces javanicus]|nr:Mitochondrial translocator assembly and maintenance protein 41 [Allomyces javanicus]
MTTLLRTTTRCTPILHARPPSCAIPLSRLAAVQAPRRRGLQSTTWLDDPATAVPLKQQVELHAESPRARALVKLIKDFKAPIRFAFAYGSAVFPQAGNSGSMVDLVLGVTHPTHWHSINLHQNRHHYSFLGSLGSSTIATLQDSTWAGAGVYYNPYVEIDGVMVKYGVVGIDRLCSDLTEWDTLYLAGRMHKPIQVLRHDSRVLLCQRKNLVNALRVVFLMHATTDPTAPLAEDELYRRVAGLSYLGDFRMRFKYLENPHKVANMVAKQHEFFEHIYRPMVEELKDREFAGAVEWRTLPDGSSVVDVDRNPKVLAQLLGNLPKAFLAKVRAAHKARSGDAGAAAVKVGTDSDPKGLVELAQSPHLGAYLRSALYDTIARPALVQSAKGILTAGVSKSVNYASSKLKKGYAASSSTTSAPSRLAASDAAAAQSAPKASDASGMKHDRSSE